MSEQTAAQPRVIYLDPETLKQHPRNEMIYGTEPVDEALCDSIREIGIDTPLEITADGSIIKGHRRWQCAKRLKEEGHKNGLTVPCVVRNDLQDDHSILYRLIEDNRHQRVRTPLQKQRETAELIELVKARRALTEDIAHDFHIRLGKIDPSLVEGMDPETAEQLDEDIQAAKDKIKDPKNKGKSYHIALQMTGQEKKQYEKAKNVNRAIDHLRREGGDEQAMNLQKLADRNLSAAEREAKIVLGDGAAPKPNKTEVRKTTVNSQCDNCIRALKTLLTLLPDQNDMQCLLAIKTVETLKKKHGG